MSRDRPFFGYHSTRGKRYLVKFRDGSVFSDYLLSKNEHGMSFKKQGFIPHTEILWMKQVTKPKTKRRR